MNIDDVVKEIEIPEGPIIVAIFNHHQKLMEKYDIIERKNGYYVPKPPHSLEDTKVQQRIKDMFWRVTEELAEAIETIPLEFKLAGWVECWDTEPQVRHFFEELSDALHFLTEASILAGLNPMRIVFSNLLDSNARFRALSLPTVISRVTDIILNMGLTANTLKNKPWKLTQVSTDVAKFEDQLVEVWTSFIDLWNYLKCNQKHVYIFYAKKNLVNQWRQKTNY